MAPMLSIIDVPLEIAELYQSSKIPAASVIQGISASFPSKSIEPQTDLCVAFPGSMVIIRTGIFKYFCNGKLVRFYSTGDIISVPDSPIAGVSICNEFGADACIIGKNAFIQLCAGNEVLLGMWLEYQRVSDLILHVLCSLFIREEFEPHSEIRQYQPGEVIVTEGDSPEYLFEMIEGAATVTVRGTEIGKVNAGEVFGEVSFLTGTERSASVTAISACLVQAIKRPDLEKFSRQRPGLIFRVSQTLANRLTEVNRRLVSISSCT